MTIIILIKGPKVQVYSNDRIVLPQTSKAKAALIQWKQKIFSDFEVYIILTQNVVSSFSVYVTKPSMPYDSVLSLYLLQICNMQNPSPIIVKLRQSALLRLNCLPANLVKIKFKNTQHDANTIKYSHLKTFYKVQAVSSKNPLESSVYAVKYPIMQT